MALKTVKIPEVQIQVDLVHDQPRRKVGLMGGTFNPPHLGHLLVAEQVLSQLGLDEVIFIPDNKPPHIDGKKTISAQTRLKMTKLSIQGNPHFSVSDIELKRGGVSYTYDTVQQLRREHPENEYYFIIGGDMVEYLPTWYKIDELVKIVNFVGVKRPGYQLTSPYPVLWVDVPGFEVSSSLIRQKVASGCSIRYLVRDEVADFIKEEGLYQDGSSLQ